MPTFCTHSCDVSRSSIDDAGARDYSFRMYLCSCMNMNIRSCFFVNKSIWTEKLRGGVLACWRADANTSAFADWGLFSVTHSLFNKPLALTLWFVWLFLSHYSSVWIVINSFIVLVIIVVSVVSFSPILDGTILFNFIEHSALCVRNIAHARILFCAITKNSIGGMREEPQPKSSSMKYGKCIM